ncbi:MAG: alpha/beta hydrolase [Bacteroidetes bacterium GWE2_29_8]|nr:MAG: alpha/beta hydrolase [Bacteroidetes bacterium GWE2_29_8]OFY18956.1 MAG: alpha/beta hydrolase [Bacteroidetes bacterium GWF2_29_10]
MNYTVKKDGNFEYIEEGEGHPLILLHGLFGTLSNFEDMIDFFGNKYKIIIPLMPLYNLPIINTNVKRLAEFVEDFIEYKQIKNISLLGNSLGGHVALIYAAKNKNNLKNLILTGSSGLYENAFGGSFPRREDYNFIKKKTEVTFYDPEMASKEMVDEVFEIVNNKGKLLRVLSLAKSAIRHNMKNELPNLDIPVCLIWGKNDVVTPPEVAEEFKELLPQADLYWIDKCGHAPMMERPQEFNIILRDWFLKQEEIESVK